MKKLLWPLVLSTVSFSAMASDRNVWDLQYLPKAKTVYGHTSYSLLSGETKGDGDTDISGWTAAQTVGFSFTDKILVSATVMNSSVELDPEGFNGGINLNGWHDPSLDGRFRFVDEGFRLDVLAGGSLGLGNAYTSSGFNGNNQGSNDFYYRGGPRVYLGAELGQKLVDLQYSFLVQFDHFFEQDERSGFSPKATNQDRNDLTVQANLLNNLMDNKLFLRSFASIRYNSGYDVDYHGKEEDGETAGMNDYRLGTGVDYVIMPDLMAQAGVYYRELHLRSGQVDDYHIWNWTVGAKYQY